jgi:hypothetical protein
MDIEGLMKRGKSLGAHDPLCVLATAVYELRATVRKQQATIDDLAERVSRAEVEGPRKIGATE